MGHTQLVRPTRELVRFGVLEPGVLGGGRGIRPPVDLAALLHRDGRELRERRGARDVGGHWHDAAPSSVASNRRACSSRAAANTAAPASANSRAPARGFLPQPPVHDNLFAQGTGAWLLSTRRSVAGKGAPTR